MHSVFLSKANILFQFQINFNINSLINIMLYHVIKIFKVFFFLIIVILAGGKYTDGYSYIMCFQLFRTWMMCVKNTSRCFVKKDHYQKSVWDIFIFSWCLKSSFHFHWYNCLLKCFTHCWWQGYSLLVFLLSIYIVQYFSLA